MCCGQFLILTILTNHSYKVSEKGFLINLVTCLSTLYYAIIYVSNFKLLVMLLYATMVILVHIFCYFENKKIKKKKN